jgi:hypothetical protein
MNNFSHKIKTLVSKTDEMGFNLRQREYMEELLKLIAEMAIMVDDTVDAIDELDMRLLEIELQNEAEG